MVEIYINKNQGITSAIKAKLDEQGYDNYIYDVLNNNAEEIVVIRDGRKLYTGKKY